MTTARTPHGDLTGRTVLITRAEDRGAGLAATLRTLGARVLLAPLTTTAPVDPAGPFEQAVLQLARYDWVAVTSVNGADALADVAARAHVDLAGADVRWAAVGPATASALRAAGVEPALVAAGTAADLGSAFGRAPTAATPHPRVLLPLGDLASGTLERALVEQGWDVERVVAYRTVPADLPPDVVAAARAGRVDLAVVAAGSAARELAAQLGDDAPPVVAIGEPSATAARDAGLAVVGVAEQPTDAALAVCVTAALA